jgi:excisionase family DNA binding protein
MPEIYTAKEAAKILKIHPGIVRMYIRDGKIKSFKVGNRIRIKQPDLLEFMNNQKQKQEKKQK